MKVEEYIIVSGNRQFVSERIKVLLSEGWELYGNPYNGGDDNIHCQGMIKYKEKIKIETKKVL